MPKPKIGTTEEIAKKFLEVTPGRSPYYEAGVTAPKADWEQNTVSAGPAYKASIAASDIEKRFTGGVKKSGTAKWQRKSKDIGVPRYGPGVQASGPDFIAGYGPYPSVIAAVEMSARQPRGSDANYMRSKQVGDAQHKKKLALIGAGV